MEGTDLESQVLALLEAWGLLAADWRRDLELLEPSEPEASREWGPLLTRLLDEGKVDCGTLDGLVWKLLHGPETRAASACPICPDSWVLDPPAEPSAEAPWLELLPPSRYTHLRALGMGDHARVFEAFDPLLREQRG